ncbi:MAG: UDP-N-acetylglucosamine 1-carboxyvinyltransferase [Rothia sp. (in: high G+C Gram-positive bacteria)]|uniref:UDP-N-acetylglucosamine 1-carboxyvinyltransferase n=1 Tax=Rothia sp. (in: high G+C Gram-positive bacteria) TaxID=1885016 RepID=UPI0026E02750|nr:UDP-N-acetylglucosamine 1-carboxyvinyltransferase [Rothia sp. (in: high G+C Gram-positive bacteria)]MDO5750963.1 UDP-N-acetylglucosamine 1-carboxyvinyltransferase [Rothia sp. (in: high G+C Gram-positive bacteria)]
MTLNISKLRIEGGVPLTGEVHVRGAKNLVPKAMVAAFHGTTPSILRNVPDISDVEIITTLAELHGARVEYNKEAGELTLYPNHNIETANKNAEDIQLFGGNSRIPILMVGPLLHTLGTARIPNLGGCKIGSRPIDYHMDALRSFGAEVTKDDETGTTLRVPEGGLQGTEIELKYPSVGATEQVLLVAVRAAGKTTLKNAAIEPEILDLINVLQKMGAIISVKDNRTIVIEGVEELKGYDHFAISDRNESASWASAALATRGDIFVRGADQSILREYLNIFRKAGGIYEVRENGIRFAHPAVENPEAELKPVVFETNVHPGFMTDWQQPLLIALTQAKGTSIVHETVYEDRFTFTEATRQMGADIVVLRECMGTVPCRFQGKGYAHSALVNGPTQLHGDDIEVPDLRGGFSHIIAALAAQGTSTVSGAEMIARGYELFEQKLQDLGAKFEVLERKESKKPEPNAKIEEEKPIEIEVQES